MKRAWIVLALLAGCEKDRPADTPPASNRPVADAAPKSDAVVVVEPAAIVIDGYRLQDVDGAIQREKLDTLLSARRGELVIGIAPVGTRSPRSPTCATRSRSGRRSPRSSQSSPTGTPAAT